MSNAIEVQDLRKAYGEEIQALDGLSFSVPVGTVFGLLGPNGAGKSTTVILTTVAHADGGSARVAGYDIRSEAPRGASRSASSRRPAASTRRRLGARTCGCRRSPSSTR